MLESLTNKMSGALKSLRGLSKLSEDNIAEALKEVQNALLSADVNFRVVREFIAQVKAECIGQKVIEKVSPGQQIIKIIHDELIKLFGEGESQLSNKKPLHIMLVGLQGSGKTTASAKLAKLLTKKGYKPALIACDVQRPAAIDQLETLAKQEDFLFYADRSSKDVPKIGKAGLAWAEEAGANAVIFDTAGRLHIDTDLIEEVKDLRSRVNPDEVLLVADSALGQEAVNVAQHFHEAVPLSGIILTKLDGDARGGAALSMKSVTGVPIKFVGTGEKMEDLDIFYPERMAQRILGMGDVVSLVERAQENLDEKEQARLAEKIKKADFDFEDFLAQMQQIKKMGSLGSLVKMMPGMSNLEVGEKENKQLRQTEALIQSMTIEERQKPQIINGSRRMRIAKGAGCEVRDLNMLLKQFQQMRKMMKGMKGGKGKKKMQQLAASMGKGPGMPGMFGGF